MADAIQIEGMEEIVPDALQPEEFAGTRGGGVDPKNCVMCASQRSSPVRAGSMKLFLIAPLALTIAGFAQDNAKPRPEKPAPDREQTPDTPHPVRRLDSVTWNPVTAELSWVVSTWDPSGNATQPTARDTYSMSIDEAKMKFKGEGRGFDPTEAKHVRVLMDMISMYAVESTVWWESGEGEKLDDPFGAKPDSDKSPATKPSGPPKPDVTKPDKNSTTPAQPAPKSAPAALRGPVASSPSEVQKASGAQ